MNAKDSYGRTLFDVKIEKEMKNYLKDLRTWHKARQWREEKYPTAAMEKERQQQLETSSSSSSISGFKPIKRAKMMFQNLWSGK